MSNQSAIFEVIRNNPGIGPAGISERLGMKKPNARRDALLLERKGLVEARETDLGYAFFPIGGKESHPEVHSLSGYILEYVPGSDPVNGVFKDVTEPSSSRAVVPFNGTAAASDVASFDSRLDPQTPARNAVARRTGSGQWWTNGQRGVSQPGQFVSTLNALYADPEEAEAALYAAQAGRLQAQSEHETWMRQEYQRRQAEEKAEREATERKRTEQHSADELSRVLRMASGLDAAERRWQREEEERRAIGTDLKSSPIEHHVNFKGRLDEDASNDDDHDADYVQGDFDPDDFDPDYEPTHIEDARFARAERARQASTGSYGPKPFEAVEGDDDVPVVKPMMKQWTLEDLALSNKIERKRRERVAARKAQMASSTGDPLTRRHFAQSE